MLELKTFGYSIEALGTILLFKDKKKGFHNKEEKNPLRKVQNEHF